MSEDKDKSKKILAPKLFVSEENKMEIMCAILPLMIRFHLDNDALKGIMINVPDMGAIVEIAQAIKNVHASQNDPESALNNLAKIMGNRAQLMALEKFSMDELPNATAIEIAESTDFQEQTFQAAVSLANSMKGKNLIIGERPINTLTTGNN